MKKINNFGLLVCLSLLSFISCVKQQDTGANAKETQLENPFNFVGEMHNEGLSFVMNSLVETKSEIIESEIERLTDVFCDSVFAEDERFMLNTITKADISESVLGESQKITW